MMKVKLVNSSGCDLDTIEAPTNAEALAKIATEWLENLTSGDKIVILHADEDDEDYDPEQAVELAARHGVIAHFLD